MALPFFYISEAVSDSVVLNEETSKHIVQVLRMQNGEQLQLTDGKGNLFTAEITDNNRKRCAVKITDTASQQRTAANVTIAVSLLKNSSRFEWFLEKATEIGVTEIIPLVCSRTEKQNFRHERMKGILISAMLQSQQTWLPVLHEPKKFQDAVKQQIDNSGKYIAHCIDDGGRQQLAVFADKQKNASIILIGPEGDFTNEEVHFAIEKGFAPVALGNTRLRTETAAVAASVILCAR